ncbi:hypothetical protein N7492_009689 [Penicillium capsulatum]|uniref:Uncharacterized protein n=1 Tax=Penicillium capsulatum TaxID=69766 RepID=A0A9W9HSX3_9EURO|nr:hypothetical protein N7492_009689 [Penicillium capsulatum]
MATRGLRFLLCWLCLFSISASALLPRADNDPPLTVDDIINQACAEIDQDCRQAQFDQFCENIGWDWTPWQEAYQRQQQQPQVPPDQAQRATEFNTAFQESHDACQSSNQGRESSRALEEATENFEIVCNQRRPNEPSPYEFSATHLDSFSIPLTNPDGSWKREPASARTPRREATLRNLMKDCLSVVWTTNGPFAYSIPGDSMRTLSQPSNRYGNMHEDQVLEAFTKKYEQEAGTGNLRGARGQEFTVYADFMDMKNRRWEFLVEYALEARALDNSELKYVGFSDVKEKLGMRWSVVSGTNLRCDPLEDAEKTICRLGDVDGDGWIAVYHRNDRGEMHFQLKSVAEYNKVGTIADLDHGDWTQLGDAKNVWPNN